MDCGKRLAYYIDYCGFIDVRFDLAEDISKAIEEPINILNIHSSNLFRYIPIIIFVVPVLSINVCYFVAASLEHVAWCIPYLDGCTSISATGRIPPESYLYRASIMPTAVLMGLYWIFNYRWLSVLGDKKTWIKLTILILGIVASVFLILYTTMLGAIDDTYQTLRRIMVTSYFSTTFLAQLILTSRVWSLKKYHNVMNLGRVPETQVLLCSLMLGLGLLSIPLKAYVTNADNIVEWNFAVLMNSFFLTAYFGWKSTGFCLQYTVKNRDQV